METTELYNYEFIGPYEVFMKKTDQDNYYVGAIRIGREIPVINEKKKSSKHKLNKSQKKIKISLLIGGVNIKK